MDSTATSQPGLTPGSTTPFTAAQNHALESRSGMLQSWNKFCFTSGYIEVLVVLHGPDENTWGYWPGIWTMGNLARPGYPATTDGMWPYMYNTCDVGTFPNQTNPDKLSPAAALHSDMSRSKYNFELSWLSGQRLSYIDFLFHPHLLHSPLPSPYISSSLQQQRHSINPPKTSCPTYTYTTTPQWPTTRACSCPGSENPGPDPSKGRGAPEIDISEVEQDKDG